MATSLQPPLSSVPKVAVVSGEVQLYYFVLLLGLTFSPVIAKGALNHCSKVLQDLKIVGRRKFNKAHNSGKRF